MWIIITCAIQLQISYWLIENGFTVLIAACDTFRAGAVEQLRTHQRRLSSLHPPEQHSGRPVVQLFEKGYGKDAAGIAMEAIAYGNTSLCTELILLFTLATYTPVKHNIKTTEQENGTCSRQKVNSQFMCWIWPSCLVGCSLYAVVHTKSGPRKDKR